MIQRFLPFRHSITFQIFKITSAIYAIVTLTVTVMHMRAEYLHIKQETLRELQAMQETFEPVLTQSLWRLDRRQWESTIDGMMKSPILVGVMLQDDNQACLYSRGTILDDDGNIVSGEVTGQSEVPNTSSPYAKLFTHHFVMTYANEYVGEVTLYSSNMVVFQKVKVGFAFIILNPTIKTLVFWSLFIWVGYRLLGRPLSTLTSTIRHINMENLEHVKVDIQTSRRNELKLLEDAFNFMIQKLSIAITKQKQTENKLKASLQEKEILLRELYHRTKNTMQVIRSMLLLQAAKMPENEQAQKLVTDTENRIMAMALVHQKLYQSHDLSRIPIQDYIQELSQLIMQSYAVTDQDISLVVESEPLSLLLDTAIPCGLILNELLSNALKYAFPERRHGEISIRLFRNESKHLELWFADNGVGVPPGFDFRQQDTLGLQTVIAIAEHQMQGRVKFTSDQGVICTIEFPDTLYRERV